jgi:hypothetical protein
LSKPLLPLVGLLAVDSTATTLARVAALSTRFGVPVVTAAADVQFACTVSGLALGLVDPHRRVFSSPFDLYKVATAAAARRDRSAGLVRAMGAFAHGAPGSVTVLDATGGCGVDALCLATLGLRMHVVERNPVYVPQPWCAAAACMGGGGRQWVRWPLACPCGHGRATCGGL